MSLSAQVAAESLPDHPLVTLLKDHLENWDFVGANKDIEECEKKFYRILQDMLSCKFFKKSLSSLFRCMIILVLRISFSLTEL